MKLSKQERNKDITTIVSYDNEGIFKGEENPNSMSVSENIECLSRYLPANKVPNLNSFRLMRIPAFIFSLIFFTCMGWGSIDNKTSVLDVITSIHVSPYDISINRHYVPTLSWGLALGLFLAIMYNVSLYRRVVRQIIRIYRHEYNIYLENSINSCTHDSSRKSIAIYIKKDQVPTAIFLNLKDGDILPTIMNIGALTQERELLKAYMEYKPLEDGSSLFFPIANDYGKDIAYIKLERKGSVIKVSENGKLLPDEIIFDHKTQTLSVRSSVEQEDMLS